MTAPAPLQPGDLLPALALPDALGAIFDLHHQGIAGLHRILVLGAPPEPARLAEAARLAAARGACVMLVAGGKPDGARDDGARDDSARDDSAPKRLFDPDRKLFAGLGLPGGGVAILSPRGRLGAVLTGADALEAALARLAEPGPAPAPRRTGAPVLLIPDVLEPALVARLLEHWRAGTKSEGRVATGTDGTGAGAVANIKRRADVFLDERGLYGAFQQRLERRVVPEMWRAFRFRAASFEAPRIGCYAAEAAGAFGAHRDNRTPATAHRRFAMSLNLNTGDYAGGTLRFPEYGPEQYEPEAGGCAIFCCDMLHEALPVTQGERFAIFTFFTDAEGAAQERKLMAQAAAAGNRGVDLR